MQYGSLLWKQGEKQNLKTKSKVADSRFTLSDEVVIDQQKQKEKHIGSLKVGEKMFDFSLFSSWFFFFNHCPSPLQVTKLFQKEKIKRARIRGMRNGAEKGYISVCHSRARYFFFFHAGLRSAALIKWLLDDGYHSSCCSIKSLPQF